VRISYNAQPYEMLTSKKHGAKAAILTQSRSFCFKKNFFSTTCRAFPASHYLTGRILYRHAAMQSVR
jgi:hypothetical protein